MRPIEILKNDNRVIERVLTCLERIAGEGLEKGQLPVDAAANALTFFREFVDGSHRRKVVNQLFPLLEARGLPYQSWPTGTLRHEYKDGRTLINFMSNVLDWAGARDVKPVQEFAGVARVYIQMSRAHIEKEDHYLPYLADSLLSTTDQDYLEEEFETIEPEQSKPSANAHYLAIATNLARQFNVPEPIQM